MKMFKVVVIIAVAAMILAAPVNSLAADGAATFKAKCSGCHGPQGEGKAAVKAPALKSSSLTEDAIANFLVKGDAAKKAPHTAPFKGISEEDAKAIAAFVKTLK